MAGDSTYVTTPPLSPQGVRSGNVSFENVGSVQFHWFTCAGEGSSRDMRLQLDGYIMKGEMNVIADYTSVWEQVKNPIILFGRNFDQDSALLFHSKLLFQIARKDVMILDSASRLSSHLPSNVSTSLQSDLNYYMHLRKQICELMAYTRCYIARVLSNENSVWMLDNLIPSLSGHLFALRLLLRSLRDLPDYIVAHSANSHGNKCSQASYHLFHLHLDLRWYHLTILHQLVKCRSLYIMLDDSQQNSEDNKLVDWKMLEEQVLLLLSDLVAVAIDRFERMALSATLKKTPFSCTCVRELWLMLQLYLGRLHHTEHGKSFWTYLNQILNVVLGKKPPSDVSAQNCSVLRLPDTYACSDRVSFSLWLLVHLAQLSGYTEEGRYVGTGSGRVESNFPQLEAVLKVCVATDNNVTEPQLRVIVRLVTILVTEWWEARSEPVMILWEYYHRRLNSAFFVPGALPDTMAVMSKTGAGLLQQVKTRLEVTAAPDEDSFCLFLRLLGKHLVCCLTHNQQRHWQQMKGRIYSKFPSTKLLALTELGLYHFVSLFLTLAVTVDLQEVGKKLQDLLSLLPIESLDLNRQLVNMKANFALMQLYIERGLDIADISSPLQSIVSELCTHKTASTMVLMRTFVEGIQDIIGLNQFLNLSEHSLIGGWITHYLSRNGLVSDSYRLLDTIVSILTKLRQSLNCIMDEDSADCSQPRKMAEALVQHVLPYIQAQCSNAIAQPPFQVADLAASFTLLSLEQPDFWTHSFDQLFMSFVSSEKMNVKLLKRYLCLVLQEEAVMRIVIDPSKNYESIVVQAWVRCCILSVNESSGDMLDLSRIIEQLPAIQDLCQTSAVSLSNADDPLFTFIELVGLRYQSLQDIHRKVAFHEKCGLYFMQVDKCVSSVVSCATSSSELVSRTYTSAACLVRHCGHILYTKSKPNCLLPSIVNLLLLPHAIYKPETQLHPFIASAIRKTLHQFIFGISKLNPKQDDFIARILRDIVAQYLPRLVAKTGSGVNIQGAFTTHPLLKCFTVCEKPEIWRFVLESLSDRFFTRRGSVPHEHAVLALGFLTDLITLKKFSADLVNLIINCSLLKIFELAMFAEEGHIARQQAVAFIRTIASSDIFKQNVDMRESFLSIFMMLCNKHLAFSSTHLFRLSSCLAQLCPELMAKCLPQLKDVIKTVELRRGVGYDPGLRNGLAKLSASLGIQET